MSREMKEGSQQSLASGALREAAQQVIESMNGDVEAAARALGLSSEILRAWLSGKESGSDCALQAKRRGKTPVGPDNA